jgi:hypothetical protein
MHPQHIWLEAKFVRNETWEAGGSDATAENVDLNGLPWCEADSKPLRSFVAHYVDINVYDHLAIEEDVFLLIIMHQTHGLVDRDQYRLVV